MQAQNAILFVHLKWQDAVFSWVISRWHREQVKKQTLIENSGVGGAETRGVAHGNGGAG